MPASKAIVPSSPVVVIRLVIDKDIFSVYPGLVSIQVYFISWTKPFGAKTGKYSLDSLILRAKDCNAGNRETLSWLCS